MAILICGGAGYIGSHMAAFLNEQNKDYVIIDNLSTGHKQAVGDAKLYIGDMQDKALLDKVFTENKIEAVINFAASSLVSESMADPLKYFDNNINGTVSLLQAMASHDVKKIVFSSTAAVYGEASGEPIDENIEKKPTNPYGASKLMIEDILSWCDKIHGIKFAVLRYFNAAGAHPSGKIGENHENETHLIPIVAQVALGQRGALSIFGDDYDTKDGTCIRDYIHVMDLSQAHLLALNALENGESKVYNLGSGIGTSVKEIVQVFEKISGTKINTKIMPRRKGDPAILLACNKKAQDELGFVPQNSNIEKIITDAWNWHKSEFR